MEEGRGFRCISTFAWEGEGVRGVEVGVAARWCFRIIVTVNLSDKEKDTLTSHNGFSWNHDD